MVFFCKSLNQTATVLNDSSFEVISNADIHYDIVAICE